MVWTTHDISEITAAMVDQLQAAVPNSGLWMSQGGAIPYFSIKVSACSPDDARARQDADCQLSLYLLHVAQDPYMRNTPIFNATAILNRQHPLSLDLTYLMTAYSPDNAEREQQAMSIALSWFHEHAISLATASNEHMTVTLGSDTLSDMSALWQSFTVAYRLSTIYRVAVAFVTPAAQPPPPAPPPTQIGLVVAPTSAPLDSAPLTPPPPPRFPLAAPLTGGTPFKVEGLGLKARAGSASLDVFLTSVDGSVTWSVGAWITGPQPVADVILNPPAAYGVGAAPSPPATTPAPGVYLLTLGSGWDRNPATPIIIAPSFTGVTTPPVLTPVAGLCTVTGAGFTPDATQVIVGGVALTPAPPPPAAPGPGTFTVSADGTTIVFGPPGALPAGLAPLRIRVDGVEAPATWQVNIP
jgi:hypothetical protein